MELYADTNPPPPKYQYTHLFYENVTWDRNIKKNMTIYKLIKHCIAVDLILKHNKKGSMLGRVGYIIYSTNMIHLRDVT